MSHEGRITQRRPPRTADTGRQQTTSSTRLPFELAGQAALDSRQDSAVAAEFGGYGGHRQSTS
jgi:hypothetical protein